MSIVSNSVNYATPFYGSIVEENFVDNTKYFSLHDNKLDGSYKVLKGSSPNLVSAGQGPVTSVVYNVVQGSLFDDWIEGATYTVTIKGTINAGQVFGVWRDAGWAHIIMLKYNADLDLWIGTAIAPATSQTIKNTFSVYNYPSSTASNATIEWIKIELGNPYTTSVPLWGNAISDATGTFASPVGITVTNNATLHALHLRGDAAANVYPTGFTYTLYNGSSIVYQNSFTNNSVDWVYPLDRTYNITHYTVSIAKINKPNYTMRLTNTFNPHVLSRSTGLAIEHMTAGRLSLVLTKYLSDTLGTSVYNIRQINAAVKSTGTMLVSPHGVAHDTVTAKSNANAMVNYSAKSTVQNSFSLGAQLRLNTNVLSGVTNTFSRFDTLPIAVVEGRSIITNRIDAYSSLSVKYNTYLVGTMVTAKGSANAHINYSSNSAIQNSFKLGSDLYTYVHSLSAVTNDFNRLDYLTTALTEGISAVTNRMNAKTVVNKTNTVDEHKLTNIHTLMKGGSRSVFGKVAVTYMSPLADDRLNITSTGTAYNSSLNQLSNAALDDTTKRFRLFDNRLDSSFKLIGANTESGWWSDTLSKPDGTFAVPPRVNIECTPRLLTSLDVISSAVSGVYLVDFTINVTSNGSVLTHIIRDNAAYSIPVVDEPIAEVSSIEIIISRINKGGYPANITEVPITSTVWYTQDNLLSIDMLEELSYNDSIESLGGVSANEITVSIDNTDKQFYFNNPASIISRQLKRNRKIVAYLGAEVVPGDIEWHCLGTYWSYSWDVPVGGLYAKVVGFDTMGLLATTDFYDHQVYLNKSLGQLIEVVLLDARKSYSLLEWEIDDALYTVMIPYAWFSKGNHLQALSLLANCYRINIYCDRAGRVVAKLRHMHPGIIYDEWSDSTNVMTKSYPTLYTTVPNIINVLITEVLEENSKVINSTDPFLVTGIIIKSFNANTPIKGNHVVSIDADAGVGYSYDVYSWGISCEFSGSGIVRSVEVTADVLVTKQSLSVTRMNEESIKLDGKLNMEISSPLIQTEAHAISLADDILDDATLDIYDADVEYVGDISLSIGDPIVLHDSITPTDKYFIKRHELFWNGTLSGNAKLNT